MEARRPTSAGNVCSEREVRSRKVYVAQEPSSWTVPSAKASDGRELGQQPRVR